MPLNTFNQTVLQAEHRLAMPISLYPGLGLAGAKVSDVVTNPGRQVETQLALHERYGTRFVLSAMDLSVEAEAFGCSLSISDGEIPTVTGRLVTDLEGARALPVPKPGDHRTAVYLEVIRQLRARTTGALVMAGCIGPFSLASRLVGVAESMEMTLAEPDLMHLLLEKSGSFLSAYAQAFRDAGADGVIMAEPAAGLLSPKGMAEFSSAYIRQIARAVASEQFTVVLHNCAAKLVHLPALLETGLQTFHFGAPMDLLGALGKVSPEVVLCGNLDPAAVFCRSTPEQVAAQTSELLERTRPFANYVLSSGCDLPPDASLANLDAFYAAAGSRASR